MNGSSMPGGTDVFNSLMSGVVDWVQMPFDAKGSAFNWILFVGLIVVAIGLWNMVLLDLTRE